MTVGQERGQAGLRGLRHAAGRLSSDYAYWLVAYALFVTLLGSILPTPLYVLYQSRWHFSAAVLTAIFAIYPGGVLVALLVVGRLSDVIGRRRVLLPSLFLSAASAVMFALAQGVIWLLVARLTIGLAVGMCTGTATAALAELHPRHDTRRSALVGSVATSGGLAVGPLLAGLLAQYAPWSTVLVFLIFLGLLVPAILGVSAMPETAPVTSSGARWQFQHLSVPAQMRGPFTLAAVVVFCSFAVLSLFTAMAPSFVTTLLHVHNRAVGGAVATIVLVAATAAQLTLRRMSNRAAMGVGTVLLATGLGLVIVAASAQSLILFVLSAVCAGLGQGLTFMGSLVLVNGLAPATQRGAVASSYFVVVYLAGGIPVLSIGVAITRLGFYRATVAYGGVVGALALAAGATVSWGALRSDTLTSMRTVQKE